MHNGETILGYIGCGRRCGIDDVWYIVACAASRCGHIGLIARVARLRGSELSFRLQYRSIPLPHCLPSLRHNHLHDERIGLGHRQLTHGRPRLAETSPHRRLPSLWPADDPGQLRLTRSFGCFLLLLRHSYALRSNQAATRIGSRNWCGGSWMPCTPVPCRCRCWQAFPLRRVTSVITS